MYFGFFSKSVSLLHQEFSSLFEVDDEEDDEEGDESGSDNETDGGSETGGIFAEFNRQFRWIHSVVKVRKITGYTIDQVFEMNIVEFFNYVIYLKSWANVEVAIKKEANKKLKLKR